MYNQIVMIPSSEYAGKMFLTPADVIKILGTSKNWTYEYLKNCKDFTVVKVGKKYMVNAYSFFTWYYGREVA